MKTKLCRPVLVETTDKDNIYNLLSRPNGNVLKCNTGAEYRRLLSLGWIPKELILISLDPNEEIEKGDICFNESNPDDTRNNLIKISSEIACYNANILPSWKKIIAIQPQLSPEYIQQFIEQYNYGKVEDVQIEMEEMGRMNLLGERKPNVFEPKLTNGFITILPKKSKSVTHLEWIYDRLIHVHGENPNYDYMLKFKEIIDSEIK